MHKGREPKNLGLVPIDDKLIVEQAARDTGFRVSVEILDGDNSHVRVWTDEPGRDHGPFWAKCRELRGAS